MNNSVKHEYAQNRGSEGSEGSEGIIRTLPEEDNKKNHEDDNASRLRYDRLSKASRRKSKEASAKTN